MATIAIKDGTTASKYLAANGEGTTESPYKPIHDVYIQDQATDIVDLYMRKHSGEFTLATDTVVDSNQITLVAGHSVAEDDVICLKEGYSVSQFEVMNVATNVLTLDSPMDRVYSTAAQCCHGVYNAAVDGSSTPQYFTISTEGLASDAKWHITRIILAITAVTTMDFGKFGGVDELTNGVVLRVKSGSTYRNIFNIKTNGEFAFRCDELIYATKAPSGVYGMRVQRNFAGPENNGVVLELGADTNDELQIVVQDDLTGNEGFYICAQGHLVD